MAKVLIQREKREMMNERERVTIEEKRYFVADPSRDFMTANGKVSKDDLAKPDGTLIKTNAGAELILLSATFADAFENLKRLPQAVIAKDSGMIITTTGLGPDSIVVDAGAGSGWLASALARVCKHVTTYEMREEFIQNVKNNIALLGLKNISVKHGDFTKGIDEKDVDLITLDMPQPWDAMDAVMGSLKIGGYLVCYLPTIPQVMQQNDALRQSGKFLIMKNIELIERPWHVEGKKVRPSSEGIGHTAFLIFARRIQ